MPTHHITIASSAWREESAGVGKAAVCNEASKKREAYCAVDGLGFRVFPIWRTMCKNP